MNEPAAHHPRSGSATFAFGLPGFGPHVPLGPETGSGSGAEASAAEAPPSASTASAASPAAEPVSNEMATVLKDLRKAKDKLKAFKEVDIEEYRRLKNDQATAAAASVAKEREDAEKRGEFERVKQSMVQQSLAEKKVLQDQIDALVGEKKSLMDKFDDMTVGNKFLDSAFVRDSLVVPPAKARVLYGAHFAHEDGVVVAYDKPVGVAARTKLVDASGEPLPFEDAIRRIVEKENDPAMLRSKLKEGAGSGSSHASQSTIPKVATGRGQDRIKAALSQPGILKRTGGRTI